MDSGLDDITDYLGFRPWISMGHHARYMKGVKSGEDANTADRGETGRVSMDPSGKHPLDFDEADLALKGLDELFMEAVKQSNSEAAQWRNPLLSLEPVRSALEKLSVGYSDNPSFKSDGLLRSDWLASILIHSSPCELKALVGWRPPEYLQEWDEFGALSDESLHEHIRKRLRAL